MSGICTPSYLGKWVISINICFRQDVANGNLPFGILFRREFVGLGDFAIHVKQAGLVPSGLLILTVYRHSDC